LISFVEIGMLITLPLLVARGIVLIPALVLTTLFVGTLLLSRLYIGWFPMPADRMREGEVTIVEQFGSGRRSPHALPNGHGE
jgi:hypothetical protein